MDDKKISPKNLAMAAGLAVFIAVTIYRQVGGESFGSNSELSKHTSGMSLLDKLDANKSPEVKKDPIALAAETNGTNKSGGSEAPKDNNSATEQKSEKKEEKKSDEGPCEDYQASLGKCKMSTVTAGNNGGKEDDAEKSKNKDQVKSAGDRKGAEKNQGAAGDSSKATTQKSSATSGGKGAEPTGAGAKGSSLSAWAKMNSGEIKTLKGKSSYYSEDTIRAGCRVLAVIEDELMVSAGEKHLLTLNVRGPIDGCKLPAVDGLRLVAYAKLNSIENSILADVTKCADRTPARKTVACKAHVKSITGKDGLEGEVYDKSGWGILFEFLLATGSAPVVAKLTETAANAKTMWGADEAGMVAASVQRSIDRVSAKIAKAFEGRQINLAQGAYVIVTFEEDVIL